MGCGTSKFTLEEDGGKRSFHPIRHRFEGMSKSRRVVSADGNPSTKLLLKDGGEEDVVVVVDLNDGRRSVSSPMKVKEVRIMKAPASVQEESVTAVDSNDGRRSSVSSRLKVKDGRILKTPAAVHEEIVSAFDSYEGRRSVSSPMKPKDVRVVKPPAVHEEIATAFDSNDGRRSVSSPMTTRDVRIVKTLAVQEESVVDSNDGRRSVSSLMKVKDVRIVKAPALQQESVTAVDSDAATKKLGGEEKERGPVGIEVESKKDGAVAGKKDLDYEDSDEEEEGGRISDFSFMGSPSFREYCMDCVSEDSVKYDGNNVGEKREKVIMTKEYNASLNLNEGTTTRTAKKERIGRIFRKVFPIGRPAAVKNLLNVTSCYNANVLPAQARAGKPAEKAV
uniref:Uncharacterized protein n=1 Tax=Davidia involucrata TaxID=16924 RepID=A0A5B6YJ98_DAVIN